MIATINRTRLKNWQYTSTKERGYFLGFNWHHFLTDSYHYYKLTRPNEKGEIFISLIVSPDKSVKDVIEDYMWDDRNYDKVLVKWIISNV